MFIFFFVQDELTAETVKNGFTFKPVEGLLEVKICVLFFFCLIHFYYYFFFSMKVLKVKIFLRMPMKVFWNFFELYYSKKKKIIQ
jgi:hypothetical protein